MQQPTDEELKAFIKEQQDKGASLDAIMEALDKIHAEQPSGPPSLREASGQMFREHPNIAAVARGVTGALPFTGAVLGSIAAPEAPILAGSLGAGAGRGAQDFINYAVGLDKPRSLGEGVANVAGETALAGATGGAINVMANPRGVLNAAGGVLKLGVSPTKWGEAIQDFSKRGLPVRAPIGYPNEFGRTPEAQAWLNEELLPAIEGRSPKQQEAVLSSRLQSAATPEQAAIVRQMLESNKVAQIGTKETNAAEAAQQASQREQDAMDRIAKAKEGLEPRAPRISETVSAPSEGGGKETLRIGYRTPKVEGFQAGADPSTLIDSPTPQGALKINLKNPPQGMADEDVVATWIRQHGGGQASGGLRLGVAPEAPVASHPVETLPEVEGRFRPSLSKDVNELSGLSSGDMKAIQDIMNTAAEAGRKISVQEATQLMMNQRTGRQYAVHYLPKKLAKLPDVPEDYEPMPGPGVNPLLSQALLKRIGLGGQ